MIVSKKMSSRVYDLDTSGGLMEEIQALIAPPESDKKEKEKKPEHPYFKRPGKGHNHDFCDACEEGGDLICCDKCPSSFHWGCHDPPLNFEDIPEGEWLCHSCKYQKSHEEVLAIILRKRSESTSSVSSTASNTKPPKKGNTNALECLIEAASAINPKQFELPYEMDLPVAFPGDEKPDEPRFSKRNKQRDFEKLPNGLVPLPARKCAECGRSCRVASLIECDFCPSYYHLDCLDPPLTAPPAGIWMCPLHVEHTLDSTLLTSTSVCERVKLWDKFSTPVDQDTVKLEFFRKIHRKNPPFRIKKKLPLKLKIQVPEMIRYHYKKPVELLPSLKDTLRIEAVYRRKDRKQSEIDCAQENINCNDNVESVEPKEEKSEDAMEVDSEDMKLCDTSDLSCNEKIPSPMSSSGSNRSDSPSEIKTETSTNTPQPSSSGNCINITNNTYYTSNVLNVNLKCNSNEFGSFQENCQTEVLAGILEQDLLKKEQNIIRDIMEGCFSNDAELELKQLDERLLKLLAFQRLQQIVDSFNPSQNNIKMPLPSELLTPADIDRISRVFASPKKRSRPRAVIRARAMLCPVVSKHFYNVRTREVDPTDVRHDASFMGFRPTVSTRFPEAVAMRYRVLNVGKGSSNDVDLEKFGYCNFIAAKHATIFFDDYTNSYELINYAPAGTYVNNVLYSNNVCVRRTADLCGDDGSEKVQGACLTPEEKAANVEAQVRDVINRKRKFGRSESVGSNGSMGRREAKMAADYIDRFECCCSTSYEDLKRGWEGSAILNHGSLLKFGCISFVFSIVENSF